MVKTIVYFFLLIILLISCQNQEDDLATNSEGTEIDTAQTEVVNENSADLTLVNELKSTFEEHHQTITESNIEELGLTQFGVDERAFEAVKSFDLFNGTIFLTYRHGGASDQHTFGDYFVSFFNNEGFFEKAMETSFVNESFRFFQIQEHFICLESTYEQVTYGEFVDEQEFVTITQREYYTTLDGSLEICHEFVNFEGTAAEIAAKKERFTRYRQSIFAYHGKIYNDPETSEYFEQFDWYSPSSDKVDDELSEEELMLVDFLDKVLEKADLQK